MIPRKKIKEMNQYQRDPLGIEFINVVLNMPCTD